MEYNMMRSMALFDCGPGYAQLIHDLCGGRHDAQVIQIIRVHRDYDGVTRFKALSSTKPAVIGQHHTAIGLYHIDAIGISLFLVPPARLMYSLMLVFSL